MIESVSANLEDALAALERAEQAKLAELADIQSSKAQVERLIGVRPNQSRATVSLEYQGKGAVEAAELYLRERSEPLSTPDIVQGLMERGWMTRSRNPTASLFSTLTNAKKKFRRTPEKLWELVEKKGK